MCSLTKLNINGPFHKCKGCKSFSRSSREAVDRIPKRFNLLETGNDVRETFWDLYAVDNVPFIRVAAYLSLVMSPPVIFCFAWLFTKAIPAIYKIHQHH